MSGSKKTLELLPLRAVSPTATEKYMSLKEVKEELRAQFRKDDPEGYDEPLEGSPEETAERKVIITTWLQRNFLGYVKYNFVANEYKGVWGTHNDRKVETKVVELLMESFEKGIHSTDEDTAVPVLMRRSWIEGLVAMETRSRTIGQVPALKMTKEGCKACENGEFCPHGGRHRNRAAEALIAQKRAEVEKLKAELVKAMGKKKAKLATKEKKQAELNRAIQRLERDIETIPLFMLKMIDKGERNCDEGKRGRRY